MQLFPQGNEEIRTAEGERSVENLAIGDLLPSLFGGLRPIQWIARYPIKKSDPSKPWVKDALPARIARGALGPNVPQADLYVTAGHALLIDGVLVPAEMLINGATIERFEASEYDELEFFHIKLESHDVIYAEGAPVETLLEVDKSAVNFAEYHRRYGTPAAPELLCAPHVYFGGRLGQLRSNSVAQSPSGLISGNRLTSFVTAWKRVGCSLLDNRRRLGITETPSSVKAMMSWPSQLLDASERQVLLMIASNSGRPPTILSEALRAMHQQICHIVHDANFWQLNSCKLLSLAGILGWLSNGNLLPPS